MIVKLDFEKTYSIKMKKGSWNKGTFNTELRSGRRKRIGIEISTTPQRHMDGVYNLAFGPLDRKERIKDKESIVHADYSKAFSTILKFAKNYLERRPYNYIGLDGSTNGRAYLYFSIIRQNYDYLNEFFSMFGIKYYVRVKRKGPELYENPFDFSHIEYIWHELFKEELEKNKDLETMFNYFTFKKQ